MNNFDSVRAITRRHFWDDYHSPLTCVVFPESSGFSASGQTIDILPTGVFQLPGPVLTAEADGSTVRLAWTEVPNAYAYIIYRSDTEDGPFSVLLSGLLAHEYVDTPENPGTVYYRVTGIEPNYGETEPSNVASTTV